MRKYISKAIALNTITLSALLLGCGGPKSTSDKAIDVDYAQADFGGEVWQLTIEPQEIILEESTFDHNFLEINLGNPNGTDRVITQDYSASPALVYAYIVDHNAGKSLLVDGRTYVGTEVEGSEENLWDFSWEHYEGRDETDRDSSLYTYTYDWLKTETDTFRLKLDKGTAAGSMTRSIVETEEVTEDDRWRDDETSRSSLLSQGQLAGTSSMQSWNISNNSDCNGDVCEITIKNTFEIKSEVSGVLTAVDADEDTFNWIVNYNRNAGLSQGGAF